MLWLLICDGWFGRYGRGANYPLFFRVLIFNLVRAHYFPSGNSWGTDQKTGKSCVGCGDQEQFYGCADISIGGSGEYDWYFWKHLAHFKDPRDTM